MKSTRPGKGAMVVVIIALLITTSCSVRHSIQPVPGTIQNELKKGDRVKISTTEGIDLNFLVDEVTSEAIIGKDQQIHFKEIARLDRIRTDHGESLVVIATSTVAVLGLIFLLAVITDGTPD